MSTTNTYLCALLAEQLVAARQRDAQALHDNAQGVPVDVPSTGAVVSSAYEQLRNAAEYSEEHLLLQRAIKRFCKLNLFITGYKPGTIGKELVVELVHAGYLQNGSVGSAAITNIDRLVDTHMQIYGQLRQARVAREKAIEWVLAFISVEIAYVLSPNSLQRATVLFAYRHFMDALDKDQYLDTPDSDNYELCMFMAAHQAILKSDIDVARRELFGLYQSPMDSIQHFREFNEQVDRLYSSELTAKLRRVIGRNGAPFRILRSLVDARNDTPEILPQKPLFSEAYRTQINREYVSIQRRLNKGLIKSIWFLLITKAIIGLAIEVPYDLLVHGTIAWVPLLVNLLFPVLYMALLKFGLKPPSSGNAHKLQSYIETLLYGAGTVQIIVPPKRRMGIFVRLIYAIIFLIPIAISIAALELIGFNVVQMAIFFVFFSTATSLGFRLSAMIRELELTGQKSGFFASLHEFFYLPFIVTGQWLSRKYSKINIVARFLDIAIELPLKALLRLIRQWIGFLNEKRDELY